MRTCLFIAAVLAAAISSAERVGAQVSRASDDPLRHGHALLIGNSHYRDSRWPALDDIPLQIDALREGLQAHFDTVQVKKRPRYRTATSRTEWLSAKLRQ